MATWQASDRAGETFRGLLLRYRGRTRVTQRALATRIGVSIRTVQEWEAGAAYPSSHALQALIAGLLEAGGLTAGRELIEVEELWAAAMRDAPRLRTPFDRAWFTDLQANRVHAPDPVVRSPETVPSAVGTLLGSAPLRRQDWGDAPDVGGFVGRVRELAEVERWVLEEHCRVVAILGLGGMGKTIFAARLAQDVALEFDQVYWRGLRNAPSANEWLGSAIGFLSDQHLVPPEGESARRGLLLELLRERRCLVTLDNLETVLVSDEHASGLRQDYVGFRSLVQVLAESAHQSCVLLTSREAPAELGQLSGETGPIRALALDGLSIDEGRALLGERELRGDDAAWASLVETYAGNGLALKVTSETIQQVFGGDIAAFIAYVKETYGTAVRGIRRLMDAQVERRLSQLELDVLRWMAIEREPATFVELVVDLGPTVARGAILEAVESLRRRSLVERSDRVRAFTLQSVVLEYVTDRLVEQAADEIANGQPRVLATHPLVKAQSKDYVRRSQERLIAQPLLERLVAANGGSAGAEQRLVALLDGWRSRSQTEQGYGPGNVVNLLRLLRGDLRRVDLAGLALRQAYLAGVEAQDASLAGARLSETVLAEAFNFPISVALSADGASLVAGTAAGEVWLWRVADRTPLLAVQGHTGPVYGVTLSSDGRLLASGSEDGTVRLWEVPGGQPLATLLGHASAVMGLALSADGRLLASGGFDGTIRLWEVPTGRALATFEGHTGMVYGVALSADGRVLVSGSRDGTIRLWEVPTGRALATFEGHTGMVYGVALSADGRLLASGSEDGTVRLWDVASGRPLAELEGHTGGVRGVALRADGWLLASGSFDGTVRLWDVASGRPLAALEGHTGVVYGVALSTDGSLLASCSEDGTVRLWEANSGRLLATLQGQTGGVRGVALSGDGLLLAGGSEDGTVRLWSLGTDGDGGAGMLRTKEESSDRLLATLRGHIGGVRGVALSGDGRLLASGSFDGNIRLWEAPSGRLMASLQGHAGVVYGVALSGDGRLLASGGLDWMVRLWETRSARLLATLRGHTGGVRGVALSADGRLLASCSFDGTIRLWEAPGGQPVATLEGHTGPVYGVALSADGQLLASAGLDGTVRLWEAPGGRPLATLEGHAGVVYGVAVSADGRLLTAGSPDGTVRLWEASSGRLLATLQGHTSPVYGVALSGDGRLLASGSFDGTIRLWDASSGTHLRSLRSDRRYERVDVTGLTGVTPAQRAALLGLGAVEQPATAEPALASPRMGNVGP